MDPGNFHRWSDPTPRAGCQHDDEVPRHHRQARDANKTRQRDARTRIPLPRSSPFYLLERQSTKGPDLVGGRDGIPQEHVHPPCHRRARQPDDGDGERGLMPQTTSLARCACKWPLECHREGQGRTASCTWAMSPSKPKMPSGVFGSGIRLDELILFIIAVQLRRNARRARVQGTASGPFRRLAGALPMQGTPPRRRKRRHPPGSGVPLLRAIAACVPQDEGPVHTATARCAMLCSGPDEALCSRLAIVVVSCNHGAPRRSTASSRSHGA